MIRNCSTPSLHAANYSCFFGPLYCLPRQEAENYNLARVRSSLLPFWGIATHTHTHTHSHTHTHTHTMCSQDWVDAQRKFAKLPVNAAEAGMYVQVSLSHSAWCCCSHTKCDHLSRRFCDQCCSKLLLTFLQCLIQQLLLVKQCCAHSVVERLLLYSSKNSSAIYLSNAHCHKSVYYCK